MNKREAQDGVTVMSNLLGVLEEQAASAERRFWGKKKNFLNGVSTVLPSPVNNIIISENVILHVIVFLTQNDIC